LTFSRVLSKAILELRKEYLGLRRVEGGRPVRAWIEEDRVLGERGRALVVVLATRGCSWALSEHGGCSMCGYIYEGVKGDVSSEQIVNQFKGAYRKASSAKPPMAVKIFTSGSFLDENEVPEDAQNEILWFISKDPRVKEVVLETRPSFVTVENVSRCVQALKGKQLTIAVGLETVNDKVRKVINKGFTFMEFKKAMDVAKALGARVKVYLLVKPPFLREEEAIIDTENSIITLSEMGVDVISLNPCTVHKGTFVELLWKKGDYRPPWLWSLVKIIQDVYREIDTTLICVPVASGSPRGPHNCGVCDKRVDGALRKFSLSQNVSEIEKLSCSCKPEWESYRYEEMISM